MIDQKSQQQLAAWGYGTLVQRELTRDALLAKEPGPVSYTHLTLPTICSV